MELSTESRALRRSNAVFKRGVDPDNLVTVLYSSLLLSHDEKSKATQRTLTDEQKLEEMFTALERRVSTTPGDFHKLVKALRDEPAMKAVGDRIQIIYEEELRSKEVQAATVSPTSSAAAPQVGVGQRSDRGMQCPAIEELMDYVNITEWYRFGLELKIDDRTLNTIDADPTHLRIPDKRKEVFRIWLDESDDQPTWWAVADALTAIREKRLARKIKEKFC